MLRSQCLNIFSKSFRHWFIPPIFDIVRPGSVHNRMLRAYLGPTVKRDPLVCLKCQGALLPMRAVCLDTGVIEYLCIDCSRHWLLVDTTAGLVFVCSPQNEKDRVEQSPICVNTFEAPPV